MNEIKLVASKGNELVSDDTTKLQQIEDELDEIKVNLEAVDDILRNSIDDLSKLAKQSQEDSTYEVLSKLVSAAAKISKERKEVVMSKASLYQHKKAADKPVSEEPEKAASNTTIIMTSEELLERAISNQTINHE